MADKDVWQDLMGNGASNPVFDTFVCWDKLILGAQ